MADSVPYTHFFWDLNVMLDYFYNDVSQAVQYEGSVDGPYIDFAHGYRSIEYVIIDDFGNLSAKTLVFLMLAETQTMPGRALFKQSPFDRANFGYWANPFITFATWEQLRDFWLEYCVAVTAEVMSAWCDVFVDTPILHEISAAGGLVQSACAILQVTEDADTYPITLTLRGCFDGTIETQRYAVNPGGGVFGPTLVSTSLNMGGVEGSLREIAMSRIELSANNGDTMFSVVGGSRAVSEEGP
ncbi:MAG: hypothetical protein H7Z74_13050 [Anaerolineae bacterium]|nr:hypothetical protein [Gemmatimonadaceae bacterium]